MPLVALAASLAACTNSDEPAAAGGGVADDSTLVVTSGARVPSEEGPRVVFLGTSLTAGLGLQDDHDTYVAQLDEMADSAGKPFVAINAGVSGETSAGGLRRLDWILREPVDVLVLELGANDGLRGQDPRALAENLTEIVRRTRTRHGDIPIVITGMEAPPNLGQAYTGAFRGVFEEVATRERTELVPFLLDGVAGVPELNQSDRIHPTAEGHGRMAANVWPVLEGVLDSMNAEAR